MLFEQLKEIDEDILEIENFIEFRYSRKLYEVSDGEINLRKSTLHHSFTQFKARVIRLYLQQPNLFSSCSEKDDVDLDLVLDFFVNINSQITINHLSEDKSSGILNSATVHDYTLFIFSYHLRMC